MLTRRPVVKDRVVHPKWGPGTIVKVKIFGYTVVVDFDKGIKMTMKTNDLDYEDDDSLLGEKETNADPAYHTGEIDQTNDCLTQGLKESDGLSTPGIIDSNPTVVQTTNKTDIDKNLGPIDIENDGMVYKEYIKSVSETRSAATRIFDKVSSLSDRLAEIIDDGIRGKSIDEQNSFENNSELKNQLSETKTHHFNGDSVCRNLIETLRFGIVPIDDQSGVFELYFNNFTVGREEELEEVEHWLEDDDEGSLTIVGPYGAGKTHLLQCISYLAKRKGFVTAVVETNQEEVAFSKPKSIYRNILETFSYIDESGERGDIYTLMEKAAFSVNLSDYEGCPYLHRVLEEIEKKGYLQQEVKEWFTGRAGKYPIVISLYSSYNYFDKTYPPMHEHMTAANIYCNILSALAALVEEVLDAKGLFLLFDESENLDYIYGGNHKVKMSWNLVTALHKISNYDDDLIEEGKDSGNNTDSYMQGVLTGLRYSGYASDIPYMFDESSKLKVMFSLTPVGYILDMYPFSEMDEISLENLDLDDYIRIFDNIKTIYSQSYCVDLNDYELQPDDLSLISKDSTRYLIKGAVEILDRERHLLEKATSASKQDMRFIIRNKLKHTWHEMYAMHGKMTPIQEKSLDTILSGENGIIVSSTASGKTEAVVVPLIERMLEEGWKGLSILYITPTRALANDLKARLENKLDRLEVKVELKTGDHPNIRWSNPPDIVITTPESLDSVITRHPNALKDLKAVVIDEIHLLDSNYRGDQLRILLKRLNMLLSNAPNTYALSATIQNPTEMGERYVEEFIVIEHISARNIDFSSFSRLEKFFQMAAGDKKLRKILVFCNSRVGAEKISVEFSRIWGPERVVAHHGSLSKSEREEAELFMKNCDRGVCVCTSTLEIGIDIGDIDCVVLADVPLSVSSLLQRIGRGNRRTDTCKVVGIYKDEAERTHLDNMIEHAKNGILEKEIYSPDRSVIVQQIFSSLYTPHGSPGLNEESLKRIFSDFVPWRHVLEIIDHLESEGNLVKKAGKWFPSQEIMDLGDSGKIHSNIPDRQGVKVVDRNSGRSIGDIYLPVDNIFVLSGKTWKINKLVGNTLYVIPHSGDSNSANFKPIAGKGAFSSYLPEEN